MAKRTTRVVAALNKGDSIRCNTCLTWKPATTEHFYTRFDHRRANPSETFRTDCKPCCKLDRDLRNKHPEWPRERVVAEIRRRGAAAYAVPAPKLKSAGHKRQQPQRRVKPVLTLDQRRILESIRRATERVNPQGYVYLVGERYESQVVPRREFSAIWGEGPVIHAYAVKVGFSVDPDGARVAGLQTGNPRPLVLLASKPGTVADERELHAKYINSNVLQEWFRPTPALLSEFGLSIPVRSTKFLVVQQKEDIDA